MSNVYRNRLTLYALLAATALSLAAGALRAEEIAIGQRVVVVRDRAPILAGDHVVDMVDRGDVLLVANVNATWVLVGRGQSGWLEQTAVVLLEAGLAHFNKTVEQNPADTGARVARAAIWVEQREWDAAIAETAEALRQNPQIVRARLVRSRAFRGKKAFTAALTEAQTAVGLAPALAWAFVAAGDAWRDQGRYDRAIPEYTRALERDPGNVHILLSRCRSRLATHLPEQWQQTIVELQQAIALSANDPQCQRECQLARGQAYIKLQDYTRAEVEFTDLLTRNSEDAAALAGRGTAYGYRRQFEKALPDLNEAVYLAPTDPQVFLARAEIRIRQYNLRGALHDIDEALRLAPQNATAFRIRAEALAKQKKWTLAFQALGQALTLEPNNAAFYLARAAAYEAAKESAMATIDRQRATEIDLSMGLGPVVAAPASGPASVGGKESSRR